MSIFKELYKSQNSTDSFDSMQGEMITGRNDDEHLTHWKQSSEASSTIDSDSKSPSVGSFNAPTNRGELKSLLNWNGKPLWKVYSMSG